MISLSAQLSACTHQISIQSVPTEADVWLLNSSGPGRSLLGKTPMSGKRLPPSGTAVLEIEKQGFLAKQIAMVLIPGGNVSIATRLQPITADYLTEKSRRDFAEKLNTNLEEMRKLQAVIAARIPEILELQSLIIERKSDEVLQQSKKMKDAWSGISSFHMLMGDFYLAEGNPKQALLFFQNALKIDPLNLELQKRIQSLPSETGSPPTKTSPTEASGAK
jgi:tetratricopeptide (TPR) repeat protein